MMVAANRGALEPMLAKLEYHGRFTPCDREAVLALPVTVRTVERHNFITRDGDLAKNSTVLLQGTAIRSKIVGTGHRQILSIHIRGELVDIQGALLAVADHHVQMLTSGKIGTIPREAMMKIAFERPAVGKAMWRNSMVDSSISREWLANIGRRDARTRIAHLLCEFSLRMKVAGLDIDGNYELPMTQEQVADATGLTPVHVNRTIKRLERDGLIERSQPRSIHVGDWRKLAEAGDFDSNYLHLRQADPALA